MLAFWYINFKWLLLIFKIHGWLLTFHEIDTFIKKNLNVTVWIILILYKFIIRMTLLLKRRFIYHFQSLSQFSFQKRGICCIKWMCNNYLVHNFITSWIQATNSLSWKNITNFNLPPRQNFVHATKCY